MGLLGAVPTPTVARGALLAIPGRPPAAGEPLPVGLRVLAPLPARGAPSAATEVPALLEVATDRASACPVVNGGWDRWHRAAERGDESTEQKAAS